MSKFGPVCQYFVWPPLFPSTALTLLGMEFTRASQVATGVLFHSSMTTSRSWWMFRPLCSSTFRLRMPHRLPLPSAALARQWSSWRCVWGRYHVGILPCGPVSEGRGSCSASVCHSTCWHSCFPQWTVVLQWRQHSCSPRPWHSHHHVWLQARHTCLCTPQLVVATHAWHHLNQISLSWSHQTTGDGSSNPCP